jgi:phage FluMu gp28-like protein
MNDETIQPHEGRNPGEEMATATLASGRTAAPVAPEAAGRTFSAIKLDRTQRRIFEDRSRILIALLHRRKGKDFVAACIAVKEAMQKKGDWWIVGMTQTQADETFLKVLQVVELYKRLLQSLFGTEHVDHEIEEFEDYSPEIKQSFRATNRMIRLPNGSRVGSLPGRNPDTLAGRGGSMIWTEFGLWEGGGYKHWRTLYPIITRGGHRLLIISTPRGKNTKLYEAWTSGEYSNHFCDIEQSVRDEGYVVEGRDGTPMDTTTREGQDAALAYMKRQYADQVGWERDFLCQFAGDASSLITWAELERAAGLPKTKTFSFARFDDQDANVGSTVSRALAAKSQRLTIGWDVARHGHISAVAINSIERGRPAELIGVIAMRGCSFEFMRSIINGIMDGNRSAVGYGDATGLGMESNETLQKKYGERWTPFTFTATGKREIASALKTAFADGTQTLPPLGGPYKFVATDIYAIQKDDTGANLVLSESVNPLLEESHCDIAYALGLARLAGAKATGLHVGVTHSGRKPQWA